MGTGPDREALLGLLGPVVAELGFDLEDIVVTPAGKRRLLRAVVDRDDGVDLDAVAEVSRAVSEALDGAATRDPMGATPYVLEVTSPGVDRPLTEPRHWRRARTRLVAATLTDGSVVEGRVTAADDEGVTLDVIGSPRRMVWAELGSGRLQVEFKRTTAPSDDEGSEEDA